MPIDLTPDLTKTQMTLQSWIEAARKRGISAVSLMNDLQDQGLISDQCVEWTDIADSDATGVITYLRAQCK